MNGWHNVSTKEPCPICGKTDWCSVSDNHVTAICRRVPSEKMTPTGGYVHRLAGEAKVQVSSRSPRMDSSSLQLQTSTSAYSPNVEAYFSSLAVGRIQTALSRRLMMKLGVPEDVIRVMDVRWDDKAKAAAFPMRDAACHIIGIRYRSLDSGKKWSLKGSHDGLFMMTNLEESDTLVICEGASDTLAAAALGLWAVGRSSCQTGGKLLAEFVKRHGAKKAIIVSDNDEPKTRPDGSTWRPGIEGAARLKEELGIDTKIILPPSKYKDLRGWYYGAGITKENILK